MRAVGSTGTTGTTGTTGALDRLGDVALRLADAGTTGAAERGALDRLVLAAAVTRLEDWAGAGLGSTDGDARVLLVRRFARAHRLLAADPDLLAGRDADLADLAAAVADPPAALLASAVRLSRTS